MKKHVFVFCAVLYKLVTPPIACTWRGPSPAVDCNKQTINNPTNIINAKAYTTVSLDVPYPSVTKHYRTDYVYNQRTDAFYKLHIESRGGRNLKKVCDAEGAALMSSRSNKDIMQLHGMLKQYPDIGEYVWVANDGEAHESAESPLIDLNPTADSYDRGSHSCLVVTRSGDEESMPCFRSLPFICKVDANDAPYDRHCGVFGKDYKYFASIGSCYKIPRVAYTWSEAYSECQAEGAHLVVINSEAERQLVQNLTNTEDKVNGARTSWFFFVGFRAAKPAENATNVERVFKTIFNQTLEQAGCSCWSEHEPNNVQNREYCGSIFKNDGKFNDVDCKHTYAFICEKEVRKT